MKKISLLDYLLMPRPKSVSSPTKMQEASTPLTVPREEPEVSSYVEAVQASSRSNLQKEKRKFPPLVLNFQSSCGDLIVNHDVVSDFIFDQLGIQKEEIFGICGIGKRQNSIRVLTRDPIVINQRFGANLDHVKVYGDVQWKCSIQGGLKNSVLRFLDIPTDVQKEELKSAISSFATPYSTVEPERFSERENPRMVGIWNGNARVYVQIIAPVPEFIEVNTWKIRIWHHAQIRKCYKCGLTTHLKANCPENDSEKNTEQSGRKRAGALHDRSVSEVDTTVDKEETQIDGLKPLNESVPSDEVEETRKKRCSKPLSMSSVSKEGTDLFCNDDDQEQDNEEKLVSRKDQGNGRKSSIKKHVMKLRTSKARM